MEVEDHVHADPFGPLHHLVDQQGVRRIVQRRGRQPEVLVERYADDVGLPGRHLLELDGAEPFAAARPFERRAIHAVKQVRTAIDGAHGVAIHVVAARSHRHGRRWRATGATVAAAGRRRRR